jgi:tetratricopeptide (TPR) repeat protein
MSYINDALRKAQRERDGRYERFGGIIVAGAETPRQPRKRRLTIRAVVALAVLIPAGLFLAVYALQQSPPVKKASPQPVAAGNPGTGHPVTTQAAGKTTPEASPAGASPQGPQAEKTMISAERAPAMTHAGAKPVPPAAPSGGTAATRETETLFKEALLTQRRGDLKGAEDLYQKILILDPGHFRALNNLGVIYMGQKKQEKAITVFGRAVILKKDYVDPYYNLACLYAQANEVDESLWYLKVAMTINGDVKNWARKDADLKSIVASPAFKKMVEGQN